MLELGFNVTEYGKAILAACFINDLGTVIALGLIFSPFTVKTLIFVVVSIVVFVSCHFSRRASSRNTAGASPSLKPNTFSSSFLPWEDWPYGQAVKRFFRRT